MSPEKIFERAQRCVCRSCGGPLEPKIIIYNKYGGQGLELYCPHCKKIEYGTEDAIYKMARAFIYDVEYDYFPDMDQDQRNVELNIAKMCDVLSWHFRKMGVLDSKGLHADRTCNFDIDE